VYLVYDFHNTYIFYSHLLGDTINSIKTILCIRLLQQNLNLNVPVSTNRIRPKIMLTVMLLTGSTVSVMAKSELHEAVNTFGLMFNIDI